MRTFDRIRETTATTGTSAYAMAGAVAGYRSFATVMVTGDRLTYCCVLGSDWEIGEGIFTSGNISRDYIFASSNGGNTVNWGTGNKIIWNEVAAVMLLDMGMLLAVRQLQLSV